MRLQWPIKVINSDQWQLRSPFLADPRQQQVRATKIEQAEGEIIRLFGSNTTTGIRVTEEIAQSIAAVSAATRRIADFVATLPVKLYRRMGEHGKEEARDHPLFDLVGAQPNPLMTSFEWRETVQGNVVFKDHYSQLIRNGLGEIAEIWPLISDHMQVVVKGRSITYIYTPPAGEKRTFGSAEIFHLRRFSLDGLTGVPLLNDAGNSFGLSVATDTYASNYMKNEANPSGVLQLARRLTNPESIRRLKEDWTQKQGWWGRKQGIAVLEEGTEFKPISNNPGEAQLMEERKYQVTEAARWFNIPPHLLADLERATFSNVEEQQREFITFTMIPWLERWEQKLNTQLLTREERRDLFFKFSVNALLRGDATSRAAFYGSGRQWGWLNADEIRAFEDMNPLPDGAGGIYLQPVNMKEAGSPAPAPAQSPFFRTNGEHDEVVVQAAVDSVAASEQPEMRAARSRRSFAISMQSVFEDAYRRIITREVQDVMSAARKMLPTRDRNTFENFLDNFYGDDFRRFIRERTGPAYDALFSQVRNMVFEELGFQLSDSDLSRFINEYLDNVTAGYAGNSRGQLLAVIDKAHRDDVDFIEALDKRTTEWIESRPLKRAVEETLRATNALTFAAFQESPLVSRLRWVAFGDACPFCTELNGKVVPIGVEFVRAGDSVSAPNRPPMVTYRNVKHPPIHQACSCMFVPA